MKNWLVWMAVLLLPWGAVWAQESPGDGFWRYDRNQIYGQELMTPEERQDFRRQLWDLRTDSERDRFRDRHRQKMQDRARSMALPNPEEMAPYGLQEPAPAAEDDVWPEDGLRRWPADRLQADGLRRLPAAGLGWSSATGVRNLTGGGVSEEPPAPQESWSTHGSGGWGVAERAETQGRVRGSDGGVRTLGEPR